MVILQGIFPKISILYFRSSAYAKLLLNKNDTTLPFALTLLNSRDNSYNKVTKQKIGRNTIVAWNSVKLKLPLLHERITLN